MNRWTKHDDVWHDHVPWQPLEACWMSRSHGFFLCFLCAWYCLNQLAWIHDLLHRHGPWAVLRFEQGLTSLFCLFVVVLYVGDSSHVREVFPGAGRAHWRSTESSGDRRVRRPANLPLAAGLLPHHSSLCSHHVLRVRLSSSWLAVEHRAAPTGRATPGADTAAGAGEISIAGWEATVADTAGDWTAWTDRTEHSHRWITGQSDDNYPGWFVKMKAPNVHTFITLSHINRFSKFFN